MCACQRSACVSVGLHDSHIEETVTALIIYNVTSDVVIEANPIMSRERT